MVCCATDEVDWTFWKDSSMKGAGFRIVKNGADSVFKMIFKGKGLSQLTQYLQTHPMVRDQILPYISLVGGFLFDVFTLGRIDQTWSLIQQGIFLLMIFSILYLYEHPGIIDRRGPKFQKFWVYDEIILQFFMGGLLSAYTLFYFKSASTWTVFTFVSILVVLLILNEKRDLIHSKFPIRHAMASLCVCSFLIYLVPILLKEMSTRVFVLSIFASVLMYFVWLKLIIPRADWKKPASLFKIIVGIGVPVLFMGLYAVKLVPPVPLAALKMGIYHDVEKHQNKYVLTYTRPSYKFWQKGDQTFLAQEGDRVYFFTSIFAPTELTHEVFVKWQQRQQDDWVTTDRIPIVIQGGREEGYRGFAFKENYSDGRWRVIVETQDERELGRLPFTITREHRKPERIRPKVERY